MKKSETINPQSWRVAFSTRKSGATTRSQVRWSSIAALTLSGPPAALRS